MEASETTTTTETAPETGTETAQQTSGQELGPVLERLDQLGQRFGEIEPLLQQIGQPAEQATEQATETQPTIADLAEDGYVDPAALENYIQQRIQSGVTEAQNPAMERLQRIEQQLADERLDGLMDVYPELQDGAKAEAVMKDVGQKAARIAQERGNPQLAKGLLRDPDFVELVYLAGQARERAIQQAAGTGEGANLEGGAAAQQQATEEDPALAILKAGRPNGPWG